MQAVEDQLDKPYHIVYEAVMVYTHSKQQKHRRLQNFSNDILWWKLHNFEYHAMMYLVDSYVSFVVRNSR